MNDNKTINPNPPANFTPSMDNYQTLQPFRYWCQKVLPLVYDDSLSYYELLCKVVEYLNKTMEDVETLHGNVTELLTAYDELQNYVNNYFGSLDVQEEINKKLDEMSKNGSLTNLITDYVNFSSFDVSDDFATNLEKAIYFAVKNGITSIIMRSKKRKINRTIRIPTGITIDFANSELIVESGNYENNYVFYINTNDGENWVTPYSSYPTVLKNIVCDNAINKIECSFAKVCGPLIVDTAYIRYFNDMFNYGNLYIDIAEYYNVNIRDVRSNSYGIYKRGQGDGFKADGLHYRKDFSDSSNNLLLLYRCYGANLTNIINGNINIRLSSNININSMHLEHGTVLIDNSDININSAIIFRETDAPINVIDSNQDVGSTLSLSNIIFAMSDDLNPNPRANYDIQINNKTFSGNFRNCFRERQLIGIPINYLQRTGCTVNFNGDIHRFINGVLSDKFAPIEYELNSAPTLVIASTSASVSTLTANTYFYRAYACAEDNICTGTTEQSVTIKDGESVRISLLNTANTPVLIARGTTSGEYTDAFIIPPLACSILLDTGDFIGSEKRKVYNEITKTIFWYYKKMSDRRFIIGEKFSNPNNGDTVMDANGIVYIYTNGVWKAIN